MKMVSRRYFEAICRFRPDISRRKYLSKMVIHGLLHLLGYDHIKDNDFHIMSKIEEEVFRKETTKNFYKLFTKAREENEY